MTCREEILISVKHIIQAKGMNEFTILEVLHHMGNNGTHFRESTIRTHITSRLCANAPNHHSPAYDDFERIGKGTYMLL